MTEQKAQAHSDTTTKATTAAGTAAVSVLQELQAMQARKAEMRSELETEIVAKRAELQVLEDALAEISQERAPRRRGPAKKAAKSKSGKATAKKAAKRAGRRDYTPEQKAAQSARMREAWAKRKAKAA
ncbi:subtilisin-like serine protease [Burkholderiales bacterium GJ-E10]|nr:subtilisin-like serine protease [Burkholderiales bacterium GJ-E10]